MVIMLLMLVLSTISIVLAFVPFVLAFAFFTSNISYFTILPNVLFAMQCMFFVAGVLFISVLVLNLIFGVSIFKKSLSLKHYRLSLRYGSLLKEPFERIQDKLKLYNTKLMISAEKTVFSCVYSSLSRNIICISIGTLDALKIRTQTDDEFKKAISGLLATEGVKITRGIYSPRHIVQLCQTLVKGYIKIIQFFFNIFYTIFRFIPLFGDPLHKILRIFNVVLVGYISLSSKAISIICSAIVNLVMVRHTFFYQKQAAKIVGGESVSLALSLTTQAKFSKLKRPAPLNKKIQKINAIVAGQAYPGIKKSAISTFVAVLLFLVILGCVAYNAQIYLHIKALPLHATNFAGYVMQFFPQNNAATQSV